MNNTPNANVAALLTAPKPQTSKEVIAANVKLLIEQLEAGHSEGLTAYLTAMGKFHSYSFGNTLEIARQMPDASRVAGMYAWNQLGRRVKKGEKGIYSTFEWIDDYAQAQIERTVRLSGKTHRRMPYGKEPLWKISTEEDAALWKRQAERPCHDCGVIEGELHLHGQDGNMVREHSGS